MGCEGNEALLATLGSWGLVFHPLPTEIAPLVATAFAADLSNLPEADRARRHRVPLPDFFIAARALDDKAPLVLTDQRFPRRYFPNLKVIRPPAA